MPETVQPRPRTENVYVKNGKPLVAKVPHFNGDYLRASVEKSVELLGGLDKSIQTGDKVMLKPNFNCSYATPLSTNLDFLATVIEVLQDAGAIVTVGELSGRADWPTEKVLKNLGVMPVLHRHNVQFINFQYDQWVTVDVNGSEWKSYRVPRSIYEANKRIYLPNMRTHSTGRFTGALKLSVGFIDLEDRDFLHEDKSTIEARIAELNLAWQPNLIIMDSRRNTTGWHGRGPYVYSNLIMASGDLVAIDAEGVKILKTYPAENRLKGVPVEEVGQIKAAAALKLGSLDYEVVESPAHLTTEQTGNEITDPSMRAIAAEFIETA
jgi:uncharacterized protein (DUF362 family)